MLKMRLQRVGRKHEPTFRLLLTESKNSTKSGRFKEILGSYDPRKSTDQLNADRIKYWLSQGVIPTDTVYNLLINHKIIEGKKKNVLPKKTVLKKPETVAEEVKETPEAPEESPAQSTPESKPEPEAAPQVEIAEMPAPEESKNPEENQG